MLTQGTSAGPLEEQLREWAGGILSNRRELSAPPGAAGALVSDFVRAHGIELLLPGWHGDGSPLDPPRPEDEAVKGAVAAEMVRSNEFVHVIKALRTAGLAPVIFKGQALAYTAYPQPWLRPRIDIDALIAQSSFEAMVNILTSLGYERTVAINADLVLPQLSLYKNQHGMSHMWDVHWRISNRPALAEALTPMEIFANAVETRIDDVAFLTPNRVYSLLIGCLHLVGHHADEIRMIWLYDIHLLVGLLNEQERQHFLERACASVPVRAACHAAFSLTQRYFPADCTESLGVALDPGPDNRWRAGRSYAATLWDDVSSVTPKRRLHFMAQHAFPSADYMMKRFAIRYRWQLPFWYAIRIGRALPKLFRRR